MAALLNWNLTPITTNYPKEQLREILESKKINVVRGMLMHWCN